MYHCRRRRLTVVPRDSSNADQAAWDVVVVVDDDDVPISSAACLARANSRSVKGLSNIFSSLKRFLAETGGQFRISTTSSCRSSTNHKKGANYLWTGLTAHYCFHRGRETSCFVQSARGYLSILHWGNPSVPRTLPVILWTTHLDIVTVAVLFINPTFVTIPWKAIGGIMGVSVVAIR
jgi:hypothetical protein